MTNDISTKVNIKEVKKVKLCDVNELEVNTDKNINSNYNGKNYTNTIRLKFYNVHFNPKNHESRSKLEGRILHQAMRMNYKAILSEKRTV